MKSALLLSPAQVAAMVENEAIENNRIMMWELIPLAVRELAMLAAKLPQERARGELTTFTRTERMIVSERLTIIMSHMEVAKQAMRDEAARTTVLH